MDPIKIAIVGYGNIGRGVRGALTHRPDMDLVQIITRDPARVEQEVHDVPISTITDFNRNADVAILCSGSRADLFNEETDRQVMKRMPALDSPAILGQGPYFAQFFNTVDSFDTHARIPDYCRCMHGYAERHHHTSIISAGWDPGTFSVERLLIHSFFPQAPSYTFWGPGVSQGHSDAVRRIKGVKDARQYTIPVKEAVDRVRTGECPDLATNEKHRRLVYVVAEQGADTENIAERIKTMPDYFDDYETEVEFISEQELQAKHRASPHGGSVFASGYTHTGNRVLLEYKCEWGDNPEATAYLLVACARACYRYNREKNYGAFSMLDIPPLYYSRLSREDIVREYL